ncbi:hypothetical protein CEK26_002061 [Fusarium fujikuroi]|nr:hypothetical protein CEK26_002061 [Fusarium fujikuroi]
MAYIYNIDQKKAIKRPPRARGSLIPSHICKRSTDKVRDFNRNTLTVMHIEWQKLANWYATLLKSQFKL